MTDFLHTLHVKVIPPGELDVFEEVTKENVFSIINPGYRIFSFRNAKFFSKFLWLFIQAHSYCITVSIVPLDRLSSQASPIFLFLFVLLSLTIGNILDGAFNVSTFSMNLDKIG